MIAVDLVNFNVNFPLFRAKIPDMYFVIRVVYDRGVFIKKLSFIWYDTYVWNCNRHAWWKQSTISQPYRLFKKIFFSQYGRFYEKTEFVWTNSLFTPGNYSLKSCSFNGQTERRTHEDEELYSMRDIVRKIRFSGERFNCPRKKFAQKNIFLSCNKETPYSRYTSPFRVIILVK